MNNMSILNEVNAIRTQIGLPILNENQLLHLELNKIDLDPINEGWWENAKYALSKLGRYKAGGKIFGKSQTDANAAAKISQLLDKKGNEVIKALDTSIKQKNPEFPNNKSQLDFVNTIIEIGTVYDSLVAATKLKPNDPGYLPVDAANVIIDDLRGYTQKYLDVDLTAAFSVFNESEEIELHEADTDLDAAKAQAAGKFAGTKAAIKKGDIDAYDTERMKTLKSWRLPLALMGTGASFGALSWLIEYMFGPKEITTITPETAQEKVNSVLANVKPGEGMTQIMNRTLGTNLNPNSNPKDVVSALAKLGGGDAKKGLEIITQQGGIFKDPEAAKQTLSAIVTNPNEHGNTLKQVFSGTWAGTGKMAGDTLVTLPGNTLSGMVVKAVTKWIAKKTVVGGAKAAIAAPILKILGIGLLTGGVAAAMARYKGRKSSRAQLLNDLIQYLRPTKGTNDNQSIVGSDKSVNNNPSVAGSDKATNNQQLYIDIKKYFQDIFNFKSQVNADTYGQGGTSNQSKLYTGDAKVTKKITQPNDINDIIKLMENDVKLINLLEGLDRLIEANKSNISNIGISQNELKLFKTNINRLSNIVKKINKFNSQDKNLVNLLAQAKNNPISTIDINSLLVSDDKSLKIFISDFNKAIYSVQFKNGNSIMDQLKLININKLSEAAERTPSKSEMNKVYNARREFLKNLPNYLKSMYAIFSFFIDNIKKGETNNVRAQDKQKNVTNIYGHDVQNATSGSTSTSADAAEKIAGRTLSEDIKLMEVINTHNNLMDIILENVSNLEEFNDNQQAMKQGAENATMNSSAGQIFQELANIIPDLSSKVAASYKEKYNKPINRIKLANFLSVVLGSLAKLPTAKMVGIINRADLDVSAYKRMLKDVLTADNNAETPNDKNQQSDIKYNGDPEKFLPNEVMGYDLSGINQAARVRLATKAAEIISRNNNMAQNSENMLTVMKQLIDDINKNGQKKIPTI